MAKPRVDPVHVIQAISLTPWIGSAHGWRTEIWTQIKSYWEPLAEALGATPWHQDLLLLALARKMTIYLAHSSSIIHRALAWERAFIPQAWEGVAQGWVWGWGSLVYACTRAVVLFMQHVGRHYRTQPETFRHLVSQMATPLIPTVSGGSLSPQGKR